MPGMERFTQRARHVLSLAHQAAESFRQPFIGTEHVLMGLIEEEEGIASRVLRDLGLETDRVREMVERIGGYGEQREGKIDLSPGTQELLELAIEEARRMGNQYISTEHLLLALTHSTKDAGQEVLRKLGVTQEQIRRQTYRVLNENSLAAVPPPPAGIRPPSRNRNPARRIKPPWWINLPRI